MKHRIALALVATVALCLLGTVASAHTQHRNGVISRGSSHVSGVLIVLESATGLEPGRQVEQTFTYTADGTNRTFCFGGTATTADENGTVYAFDHLSYLQGFLRPGEPRTGTIRGWWREPGSGCEGPPIMLDDGPAEITISVP